MDTRGVAGGQAIPSLPARSVVARTGLRGYRDAAIYPLGGPDVAKARRLAGNHRGHAVMYTCNLPSCLANAQVIRENLAAIGIGVEIRQFPLDTLYRNVARPKAPWDIADVDWVADYGDPFDMLNLLFTPFKGYRLHAAKSINWGGFADPSVERRLRRTAELAGARRYLAYARLDADLASDAAPLGAYANPTNDYFFSTRVGCQVVQPNYGLDLAALCNRPCWVRTALAADVAALDADPAGMRACGPCAGHAASDET